MVCILKGYLLLDRMAKYGKIWITNSNAIRNNKSFDSLLPVTATYSYQITLPLLGGWSLYEKAI